MQNNSATIPSAMGRGWLQGEMKSESKLHIFKIRKSSA